MKRSEIKLHSAEIMMLSQGSATNYIPTKSRLKKSKSKGKQKHLGTKRGRGRQWYCKVNANANTNTKPIEDFKPVENPKPLSEPQRIINEAKTELEKVLKGLEKAEATYYGKIGSLSSKIKSTTDEYNALNKSLTENCDVNGTFKNFKLLLRVLVSRDVSKQNDETIDKYSNEDSTRKYIKNLAKKEQLLVYEVNVLRISVLKSQKEVVKAQERLARLLSGKYEVDKELKDLVKPVEFDPTFENPIQSSAAECDHLGSKRQERKTIVEKIKATCMVTYALLKEKLSSFYN